MNNNWRSIISFLILILADRIFFICSKCNPLFFQLTQHRELTTWQEYKTNSFTPVVRYPACAKISFVAGFSLCRYITDFCRIYKNAVTEWWLLQNKTDNSFVLKIHNFGLLSEIGMAHYKTRLCKKLSISEWP